jgi:poly(ADP-ribose) glycohydrolase ARH3
VGDALGMPVENWSAERIRRTFGVPDRMRPASPWLQAYAVLYGLLKDPRRGLGESRLQRGSYTDDTQMMIALAESLAERGGFDGTDMAARFVADYDPRRGYGPGTVRALRLLRGGVPWQEAGRRLFGGNGSFGNGAAMRAAPIGVFHRNDLLELRRVAQESARITHAHPLGMEGAVLIAFAVALLQDEVPAAFAPEAFLRRLREAAAPLSAEFDGKLGRVEELLRNEPTVEEVVRALGNDTSALAAVPAALYAVLSRAGSFRDAVVFAVSIGGDTDTIGAMAGALSGALHGVDAIPEEWLETLENGRRGREYVRRLADRITGTA